LGCSFTPFVDCFKSYTIPKETDQSAKRPARKVSSYWYSNGFQVRWSNFQLSVVPMYIWNVEVAHRAWVCGTLLVEMAGNWCDLHRQDAHNLKSFSRSKKKKLLKCAPGPLSVFLSKHGCDDSTPMVLDWESKAFAKWCFVSTSNICNSITWWW
jgi:hypothetical protein